jgi:vacuolar-type H+-ATPase subunit I/STV1
MNMQQLRGFVSLENRKKDLDAELKSVKQQLDDLEEALVPQFIEDGVQRMTVDGRTVSIQQDVYASPLNDREDVVDALKQSELGQYVAENYNTNSLTAFVREVKRDVELRAQSENRMYTEDDVRAALPEPLGRALKISFVHKLSSRKA